MENNFYSFGENEGIDTINLKLRNFAEDLIDSYLKNHGRKIEKGIAKYYSIRDGKFRLEEDNVDEVIGYIAGTVPNNKVEV